MVKKTLRALTLTAVTAGMVAVGVGAATATVWSPVANPSFRSPQVDPASHTRYAGDQIPGWTVTRGNVDVIGRDAARTGSMSNALDLNGNQPGAIEQNIPVTANQRVTVTFRAGRNVYGDCSQDARHAFSVGVANQADSFRTFQVGRPGARTAKSAAANNHQPAAPIANDNPAKRDATHHGKSMAGDDKAADNRAANNKAANNKTANNKAAKKAADPMAGNMADNKANRNRAGNNAADNQAADNQAADSRAGGEAGATNRAGDDKAAGYQANRNRAAGNKADNKADDPKAGNHKADDKRAADKPMGPKAADPNAAGDDNQSARTAATDPQWQTYTYEFTTADDMASLTFRSENAGPCGAVITDIRVTEDD